MERITIQTKIKAPVREVWNYWTDSQHIVNWNQATEDWHTPTAENDLRVGGKFLSSMESPDGSFRFDFGNVYSEVELHQLIAYTMSDERSVEIDFSEKKGENHIVQSFDPESENSIEMQRQGWQAILDNFKKYVEA